MIRNVLGSWLVVPLAGTIMIAALTAYFWNFGTYPSASHDDWGDFGSYFGGLVSPIFSLFALWAIVRTMIDQSNALAIAREEQMQTRVVLENISHVICLSSVMTLIGQLLEKNNRTASESAELAALWDAYRALKHLVQVSINDQKAEK